MVPHRLEETQADLAYRVEHLVGEARAARLGLHEARERLDAGIYRDDVVITVIMIVLGV